MTGEVEQAVRDAIRVGYRHIDCAAIYGNEAEVGKAIAAEVAAGTVTRGDLYIVSKVCFSSHHALAREKHEKLNKKELLLGKRWIWKLTYTLILKTDAVVEQLASPGLGGGRLEEVTGTTGCRVPGPVLDALADGLQRGR